MVFPSIPAYLVDPSNWQPQAEHFLPRSSTTSTSHLLPPPPPPPQHPQPNHAQSNGGGSSTGPMGSIRPGSMVDRARMANIPLPEAALKCPRCESTNTKFCYFNNYSLSQPRHFCKACKRYWTRGGALRNVPVGGGCRRNKRSSSKGTRSKSPVSSDRAQTGSANSSSSISSHGGVGHTDHMIGPGQQNPPLRFMAPLHHLTDFNAMASSIGLNYGLNYSGLSAAMSGSANSGDHYLNFQLGGGGSFLGMEQWPLQQPLQFPFMSGLEAASTGLFEGGGEAGYGGQTGRLKPSSLDASQVASNSVKMEESQDQVNLGRQFLGMNSGSNGGNHHQQQQYNGVGANSNAWSDFSGFSSSSMATSNQL